MVLHVAERMRRNSLQSAEMERACSCGRILDFSSSSIQNRVSEHSFMEILHLARKSFFEAAKCASARLAPMLVPLRRIWSARLNSFCSSRSHLESLTTRMAKAMLFALRGSFFICPIPLLLLHPFICPGTLHLLWHPSFALAPFICLGTLHLPWHPSFIMRVR